MKEPSHLALHPFGQIPTYEGGDLALFEMESIVFHIAERHAVCCLVMPTRGRVRSPDVRGAQHGGAADPRTRHRQDSGDKPWIQERLPLVEDRVRGRLNQHSVRLSDADWLDGTFSAVDLMMVSVLLGLRASGIPDEYPNLPYETVVTSWGTVVSPGCPDTARFPQVRRAWNPVWRTVACCIARIIASSGLRFPSTILRGATMQEQLWARRFHLTSAV